MFMNIRASLDFQLVVRNPIDTKFKVISFFKLSFL